MGGPGESPGRGYLPEQLAADDYEAHLQVVHRGIKNFSFYMSKALEQKKFQQSGKTRI